MQGFPRMTHPGPAQPRQWSGSPFSSALPAYIGTASLRDAEASFLLTSVVSALVVTAAAVGVNTSR